MIANEIGKAKWIAGVVVLLVMSIGFGVWFARNSGTGHNQHGAVNSGDAASESGNFDHLKTRRNQDGAGGAPQPISIEDRLVSELRQFYAQTIADKSVQVSLLKVKHFLIDRFPQDGHTRFIAIIKQAFPDLAGEILKTVATMERYQAWLETNAHRLSQLNALEKEGTLWEKRRELFGDDADIIWSEEVLAYEQKKQDLRETIRILDESTDSTIYEKLDIYRQSLQDAYQGSPEAYVLRNKDMVAKVFFGIESVQAELSQLDPVQRQEEINNIRREMGYSQEQIEKLEALDQYRERRWENGYAYMQERDQLAREFDGPELDAQLETLQEKYFKHEAKTIALEEKDGFFRYKRPRLYGRN